MGRAHLVNVWRKATHARWEGIDDSRELLSYRTAVVGLAVSLAFVAAWLYAAGMAPFVILTFLPIFLLTFLGLSRVVAELGLVYVYYQVQPFDAVLANLGHADHWRAKRDDPIVYAGLQQRGQGLCHARDDAVGQGG